MNKLKMKAKAGVTLVELLVVILIVTILSVSMLPLLKPFVVQAQYAAEPIPVIGNLRTKIGLYQYDKTTLPCMVLADDQGAISAPENETWKLDDAQPDLYNRGHKAFSATTIYTVDDEGKSTDVELYTTPTDYTQKNKHLGLLCDIDYQELKGKRSRPNHYQYLVMKNGTASYAYFLGCFGNGVGLPKSTGYAVCEIVVAGHKYVGTWERYKPVEDPTGANQEGQICFTSSDAHEGDNEEHTYGCYVGAIGSFDNTVITDDASAKAVIDDLARCGWKF